jgi:hypothetical protein
MKRTTQIRTALNLRVANQVWAQLMCIRMDRHDAIKQLTSVYSYSTVHIPD